MRIGELSRRSGVSIRALRYYEEQGLLTPGRDANSYRSFDESDVERVAHIQLLYSAGMRSSCILEVLSSMCGDGSEPYDTEAPTLVNGLQVVRDRLIDDIAQRQRSLAVLERILTAARGPAGSQPAAVDTATRHPHLVTAG